MKIESLVKAKQDYDFRKTELDKKRYVNLDLFRRHFPELHIRDGQFVRTTLTDEMLAALSDILDGGKLGDEMMMRLFGFTNTALENALKNADPIIKPLPNKLVLMTFDDSTIDHYTIACPVLERYGGKANLFTTEMQESPRESGFSDKDKYMSWEQIKELHDRGHEIVNHSMHHNCLFTDVNEQTVIDEILGLEQKCAEYGIPKPTVVGYPRGSCNPRIERLMRELGYQWGRGDMKESSPILMGKVHYDPYYDTPLVMPSVWPRSIQALADAVNATVDNKVMLLVLHKVTDDVMVKMENMTFNEMVTTIYDEGGECITFGQLSEFIDPSKAYICTHPAELINV